MKASLVSWWDGRDPRERGLLAMLGILLSLFLLIFAVILPVRATLASADAQLDRAQADLRLVSRLSPDTGTTGPRAAFDRSVLIAVARAEGLKLTRVQPSEDGSFAVWIDDAQTTALYGFFETLMTGYAVSMDRAIVSADANGRLSAQFTVR